MARAYQQSQPFDDHGYGQGDWQSLRQELVTLLDQVESRVSRPRPEQMPAERPRDARYYVPEPENESRHRDALRSVQRAISRFEEPGQPMPPNPRDSLQAAISQIRSRQGEAMRAPMAPPPAPRAPDPSPLFEKLALSVNGLSGRLERLEGEIKAQIKSGANVKDVADQVSQLAHVVELLAGAVGETGQVKRLEGQIASLGKIMSQGREMDIQTLTRRLDDVASTVGQLAELQVHYADRVQNPVESQAFQDGMRSIESSVRNVYDRIDALERHASLSPADLDHVTAEMARFTEALKDGQQQPLHLVELVDALNSRISDIENGDRLLHGLRKDLGALRDAVTTSLEPRFDAIEQRMESLSTRDDMAEIARQIGTLGDRIGERPIDPGLGQLEVQVRQLVARMDQTGEQLSGLAKLYSGEPAPMAMPDFDAVAEMVATRAAEAVQRSTSMPDYDAVADMVASRAAQAMQRNIPAPDYDAVADMVASRAAQAMQRNIPAPVPDAALAASIEGLEARITTMLRSMQHDPEVDAFDGMQAGISEVNERLKRLELSLLERDAPAMAPAPRRDYAEFEAVAPAPRPRVDSMPRRPTEDAPLNAPAFPEPTGSVAAALEARNGPRKRHPGLDGDVPLADRYDAKPPAPALPAGFEPEKIGMSPAPQPSLSFADLHAAPQPVAAETAPVTASSRNTFIEAARRAAQRQTPATAEGVQSGSLIGRALARFQTTGPDAAEQQPAPVVEAPRPVRAPKPARKARAAAVATPMPAPPPASVVAASSIEPSIGTDGMKPPTDAKESFLSRNRRTILLGAAVVALAFLTINLVAQRLGQPAADSAAPSMAVSAPATTGDIANDVMASEAAPIVDDTASSMPPRIVPMAPDAGTTGSINNAATQSFSTGPMEPMPSAFSPTPGSVAIADPVAPATPDANSSSMEPLAPLKPQVSPVKVDLPPENVGSMDLRQAAANGDPRAQFEVAAIYTEGRAVPQDLKAAATWYERAAEQGFAPAEYRLGSLYENGNGLAKDLNTAQDWYERAAEAGNRMSMHNLAALYAGGQLGKQQFDSAAKWFEEAADRGLTDSQFNLGMLYARGLGVPQSLNDSFKWFGIAALSGDKDAAKARDDVARSLDADTVARLTAEINAFKPAPIDLKANFAPIGTWTKNFDAGETITTKDIVASVQKALGKLGYDIGTPDGVAGKKTSDAIKSFEDATGMNQTGSVNPRLLAVLGSQPV